MEDRRDRLVSDLAHGERRLLELALALAADPVVVLLDEPMAGAGPEESQNMTQIIKQLKGQVSILLIEHDMDAVFQLADRLTVLVEGTTIANGTPAEISANARRCAKPIWGVRADASGAGKCACRLWLQPGAVWHSLEVPAGACVSLMGRNGMGKNNHYPCDYGDDPAAIGRNMAFWLCGQGPDQLSDCQGWLGLVPEGRQIFPNLSVAENLTTFWRPAPPGRESLWTMESVLELFPRLAERLNNAGNQLSGGEQQMLAIGGP